MRGACQKRTCHGEFTMSDHEEVNRNIARLESMIPRFLDFGKPDWKAIWTQIKLTSNSFKGVRFPTREEHQKAWDKFQLLISNVKAQQEQNQKEWEINKDESERLRNIIVSQARSAQPCDGGLADILITIATGGLYPGLNSIMGPFDEEKRLLQSCSQQLKEGWSLLHVNKEKMLARDKGIAFEELNQAKEALDARWDRYKKERQRVWDAHQQERAQKRLNWRLKTEANIQKNEELREKLNAVIAHKERHLDELHDKLREARSDDYRSRVSGWISEEESKISDIKESLRNIENWIQEDRDKLHS